ncbi:hypothetical protein JOB18_023615 [Solea senegalensis]|uniref:Uncharacterized protein n=1 Tax=Solea senegalensis TaxID=28829 RepID=A0AAV6SLY5_SOLSE|nr:hypothetical protein JOB18_023615 [Solea senegalensis]
MEFKSILSLQVLNIGDEEPAPITIATFLAVLVDVEMVSRPHILNGDGAEIPGAYRQQQAFAPHNNTIPLDAEIFSSRDSNSSYHSSMDPLSWIILILRTD